MTILCQFWIVMMKLVIIKNLITKVAHKTVNKVTPIVSSWHDVKWQIKIWFLSVLKGMVSINMTLLIMMG